MTDEKVPEQDDEIVTGETDTEDSVEEFEPEEEDSSDDEDSEKP